MAHGLVGIQHRKLPGLAEGSIPTPWEAETGESLEIPPGELSNKTLSQENAVVHQLAA